MGKFICFLKSVSASGDQFEPTVTEENVGKTLNNGFSKKNENVDLYFNTYIHFMSSVFVGMIIKRQCSTYFFF